MSVYVIVWAYCLSLPPKPCFAEQDIKGKSYHTLKDCEEVAKMYAAKPSCMEIKLTPKS